MQGRSKAFHKEVIMRYQDWEVKRPSEGSHDTRYDQINQSVLNSSIVPLPIYWLLTIYTFLGTFVPDLLSL